MTCFRCNNDVKLDYADVLMLPRLSTVASRADVNLTSAKLHDAFNISTNGIIAANMDGVGTIAMATAIKPYGCMTALHKHYDLDTLVDFFSSDDASHAFYSMGISHDDHLKYTKFIGAYELRDRPVKICIDVANGYLTTFHEFCNVIRTQSPNAIIMGGNIVTTEGARQLGMLDIIKIGIGPGGHCLTRSQTGIGYPQFSAVYDICNSGLVDMVCADGGCTSPGDVAKAFGAGATMVMLGSMLAGTDQGGGDIINVNGQRFVEFYGMSSATAQRKHNGGLAEYRASEGRTTLIPYKGNVQDVIKNILGGLRSACTYVGAATIDQLHDRTSFIRVNNILNRSMDQFTCGN